jgi:hypothetical protein
MKSPVSLDSFGRIPSQLSAPRGLLVRTGRASDPYNCLQLSRNRSFTGNTRMPGNSPVAVGALLAWARMSDTIVLLEGEIVRQPAELAC